jgi:uncharacterized protein with PIN domain
MKFLVDRTTGKLAKKLRALGFDAASWTAGPIEEAVREARAGGRMFLTRSRRIPGAGEGLQVTIVEANNPAEQVREVFQKLRLELREEWFFSRCLLCNEELLPVAKGEVEGRVPDFIYRGYDSFRLCPRCRRVYWPGTHLEKMKREVGRILPGKDKDPRGTKGKTPGEERSQEKGAEE